MSSCGKSEIGIVGFHDLGDKGRSSKITVGGAAAGIGMRTTQTAISGDWSHWQGDIFNPAQVATDLAFGAAGGAVGYGVRQVFGNITKNIQSKPDFYVTLNGEAIPATKQGILNNLKMLTLEKGKYYGQDSKGPIRIRLDLNGHPPNPNFNGQPNPIHEVPHMHIERKLRIITGSWDIKTAYPWDLFN